MPPSASSKRPRFWRTAPVKAPFSWPNSSLSEQVLGQRTAVHLDPRPARARARRSGSRARTGPCRCRSRRAAARWSRWAPPSRRATAPAASAGESPITVARPCVSESTVPAEPPVVALQRRARGRACEMGRRSRPRSRLPCSRRRRRPSRSALRPSLEVAVGGHHHHPRCAASGGGPRASARARPCAACAGR